MGGFLMAVAEMVTRFGEEVTCRWAAGVVYVQVGSDTERTAFALATEADIQIYEDDTGKWWIVYAAADGTPVRHTSADEGRTWSLV